jgi:ketosteroid isomerase-like protein
MYHTIVRSRLRQGMGRLTRDKFEAMLREFPAGFELYFPGLPENKGPRFDLEQSITLYRRIFELYPDLTFAVKDILVAGWPANTRVAVLWTCRATRKDGQPYTNQGLHIFYLRWGKVTRLEIYCDTQSLAEARQVAGLPVVSNQF